MRGSRGIGVALSRLLEDVRLEDRVFVGIMDVLLCVATGGVSRDLRPDKARGPFARAEKCRS